jgi:hypothetical protein
MGVWQGLAMDSLKFTRARHALPFYALRASGVVPLQGGRPGAVFYPFGHPMPYAYGRSRAKFSCEKKILVAVSVVIGT